MKNIINKILHMINKIIDVNTFYVHDNLIIEFHVKYPGIGIYFNKLYFENFKYYIDISLIFISFTFVFVKNIQNYYEDSIIDLIDKLKVLYPDYVFTYYYDELTNYTVVVKSKNNLNINKDSILNDVKTNIDKKLFEDINKNNILNFVFNIDKE